MVSKLPYIETIGGEKFTYKDNEPMLEEVSSTDLDKTYVPTDDKQYVKANNSFKIKIHTFCNPIDINWVNMKATKETFACKKFLLTLASIAVLIFLTTPTVNYILSQSMLQLMSSNDAVNGAISLSWTKKLPLGVGFLVKEFMPPLIVIMVNSILIYFIQILSSQD